MTFDPMRHASRAARRAIRLFIQTPLAQLKIILIESLSWEQTVLLCHWGEMLVSTGSRLEQHCLPHCWPQHCTHSTMHNSDNYCLQSLAVLHNESGSINTPQQFSSRSLSCSLGLQFSWLEWLITRQWFHLNLRSLQNTDVIPCQLNATTGMLLWWLEVS